MWELDISFLFIKFKEKNKKVIKPVFIKISEDIKFKII